MRTSLFLLLLLSFTVMQPGNLVPWSASRKLTWEDFKGNPDPHSPNAALTSSNINIGFGYDDKGFWYNIKCNFDKNRSWVRIRNNEVLVHEQGHFDLAEVYARKLYMVMKAYRPNDVTISSDVNHLYDSLMTLHRQTQVQYDQETDYSRNRVKQQEWLQTIEQQLHDTAPYANYRNNSNRQ